MHVYAVGKLVVLEESVKPPYFGIISFIKHLYNIKQTSVVY